MAINKRNKFELLEATRENDEIIETEYIPEVKRIEEIPLEKTVIEKKAIKKANFRIFLYLNVPCIK